MKRQASSRLSAEAQAVMDGQTAVKQIVKDLYLRGFSWGKIETAVRKEIAVTQSEIDIEYLKDETAKSLIALAWRVYNDMKSSASFGDLAVLWAVIGLRSKSLPSAQQKAAEELIERVTWQMPKGTQMTQRIYHYWKDVKATVAKLADERALDESDSGESKISLRAKAEIIVREEFHKKEMERMRAKTRLVIISTHSDCSDRCAPYQGRVYSLDGTSGTTPDGRSFVPIEEATENPRDRYVTRAGRVYQNGLFGFNCYDTKTEVYTDQGWKKFAELNGSESVLTLNPETRGLEWQTPTAYYCKEWHGEMTYLHNQNTNLLITPDHSCLYFTQKNSALRFREAKTLTTASYLYAGCDWQGNDCKTINVGGVDVDSELYCKLLAYYLADGSRHCATAIKIAQTNNDEMFAELSALPFKVWHDEDKIVVYSKQLTERFATYGHSSDKYIPKEIKGLSRRLLNVFLNAYVKTDGYVQTSVKVCGATSRHRSVFTTSKRMADDLTEIALKAGLRPKIEVRKDAGREQVFKNGTYTINNDLYVIHLNWKTTVTHFAKDSVRYDGNVYCVEVPNHTLYVRRNGQTVWCGNCRHIMIEYADGLTPPTESEAVRQREVAIDKKQREYEREIIRAREKAVAYKGIDRKEYMKWKIRASKLLEEYADYSHKHGRSYYTSRIRVL